MLTLLSNIKSLLQIRTIEETRVLGLDMKFLPQIENAYLILEDGKIHSYGSMSELPMLQINETIDASGRMVLPTWIDAHTHLVFAASREQEFVDRINGLSYAEIAAKGGGILNSAAKLATATEEELYVQAARRLDQLILLGTGAIEIKSGYGLSVESELKMLRVIQKLKEDYPHIPIKSSFLAAHAFPLIYRENHQAYIDIIINEMLPLVAAEELADYMDVFCEEGFFSVAETEQLLEAGWKYGLKPKIHANQLHRSGGVQVGVKHKAVSVDHLESMGEEEIASLRGSNTIPTLLPGAAFFLGMHYQPARLLIEANLPVCLASDYNPGTCPSGNMNTLLTIACTQLKMTPEEAINAQTINAAAAMELESVMGSITVGKKASLILTKPIPSVAYLPYAFGENLIERVII
ncbi:imidazolonepropionase [Taibaiella sp. KBW10]|uniref:imidazolonepropionase n=1 Tax=Taibaiella sp. KBW10 TaxID=2153357 RepID=UPI000F5A699E|nr:imidazolonepropionase [Taibaiella sp. KBW10]RQO31167.1 imidazolonepropionase [Taibaiella sp. KBW10]